VHLGDVNRLLEGPDDAGVTVGEAVLDVVGGGVDEDVAAGIPRLGLRRAKRVRNEGALVMLEVAENLATSSNVSIRLISSAHAFVQLIASLLLHSHLDANGLADVESSDEEKKLMKRRISKLEGEVSLLRRQMDQMQSMMIMSMRNFSASSAESLYPRAESLYPPRPQQRLTLVFVYGTLKRGFFNYEKFLSDQAAVGGTADFIDTCTTVDKRRLCICDFGVPAIIDDALGNGIGGEGKRVKGEIFAVDDEKLLVLDKLEGVGVEGWCSYERKPISVVRSDGEEVEVEFYLLVGAEEGSEVFSRMMNRVKDEGGFLESYTKAIHDAEYKPRAERGEA